VMMDLLDFGFIMKRYIKLTFNNFKILKGQKPLILQQL